MGVTRIKRKLITAAEYSRKLSRLLEDKLHTRIADKEMVFLTVCIAEGLDRGRLRKKQRVLVTSKYGLCEARRYAEQLQKRYQDSLAQIASCELYEVEKIYDQFDVILINDRKLAAIR